MKLFLLCALMIALPGLPCLAQEPPAVPVESESPLAKPLFDEADLTIHRFEIVCNSYLLTCKETGEFVAIDPGPGMVDLMREHIASGHAFKAIWLTHEHPDHIAGLGEIRKAFADVPILTHAASKEPIAACIEHWAEWGMDEMSPVPPVMPDTFLEDGATVKVGKLALGVLFAPGHSKGSLGYRLGDRFLFIGDVLFKNSVGRTDLDTSDHKLFQKSLSDKLWDLPGKIVALPGHGPHTTIGAERENNWLFQDYVREARGGEPIQRPWMGVKIAGVRQEGGLALEDVVEGSPAEAAGLKAGDVILEFDGVTQTEMPDLWKVIKAHEVGDAVKMRILREGETLEVEFTFGKRPPAPK